MRVAIHTDMSPTSYVQLLAFLPYRPADLIIAQAIVPTLRRLRKLLSNRRISFGAFAKTLVLYNWLRLKDGPSMIVGDLLKPLRGPHLVEGRIIIPAKAARIRHLRRLFNVPIYVERQRHCPRTLSLLARQPLDLLYLCGGYIQKDPVLQSATYTVTVHHSYLPRHRGYGGGEIWGLVNRDLDALGVSIIRTDSGVDTGQLLVQERLKIQKGDTLASLMWSNRLIGADLMRRTYDLIAGGNPQFFPQDESRVTHIKGPPTAEQAAAGMAWLATLTQ